MNKTITFNTLTHKVVPLEPTDDMKDSGGPWCEYIGTETAALCYKHMLAAVPDQLHGVVEYSGEPVAKAIIADWRGLALEMLRNWDDLPTDTLLYDHPAPSQLDPFEEVYCALKGCEPHGLASCDDFKDWKASLSAPSQPSTEVLHDSDCSVHNGPAYPAGPCTCKATRDQLLYRIGELEQQPSAEAIVAAQPPCDNAHVKEGCEQFTHWTITAPSGMQWTGESLMESFRNARSATVDPVAAHERLMKAIEEDRQEERKEKEALVQAALEAACDAVYTLTEKVGDRASYDQRDLNCCENTTCELTQAAERVIRALDKQQIIESCTKGEES